MKNRRIIPQAMCWFIAATFGSGLVGIAAAADPCPESCVFGDCSIAARRDTLRVNPGVGATRASYDLPIGMIRVRGDTGADGCADGSVEARDRFTLVGPLSEDPVVFTVVLHLDGFVAGNGSVGGSLQEGGGPPVGVSGPEVSQDLTLPLVHPVGEPFELLYSCFGFVCGGPNRHVQMDGALSFSGLPVGYGVISCQGYSSGPVVPTRTSTWADIKVRYR